MEEYTQLFSSPIGESTFSTETRKTNNTKMEVFVPYRGIYFLYPMYFSVVCLLLVFSSPIGESTFSTP